MHRLLIVVTILAFVCGVCCASPSLRVGTAAWMRAQPVGSIVTLDTMIVDEVKSDYLIVREPTSASDTVRVEASARVERWQSVEVTGRVAVADTGDMYLAEGHVRVYVDSNGNVILFPLPKPWSGPLLSLGTADMRPVADGLTYQVSEEQTLDEEPEPPGGNGLKYLPDGALLHLYDRVVSVAFDGWFYIEDTDRSSAIRVDAMYVYPMPGDLVEISGVMGTENGERLILVDTSDPARFVTTLDYGYPIPRPVGMPNRAIGGGAAGPNTPAVGSSTGLNNTGMLVTAWGRVIGEVGWDEDGAACYYIDDGSGVPGEPDRVGVKVHDFVLLPSTGDYLTVTGVASAEMSWATGTGIASLRAAEYTATPTGVGTGTLSGSVTAGATAANKTVRISGTGGGTSCTLNSTGSGSYSLQVRAGGHSFAADLSGFTRDTASVSITASQTATCNFTLIPAQAVVMLSAEPGTIEACTGEPSTITVVVYHDSGTICPSSIVTFATDRGQFAESTHTQEVQVTTDVWGRATVQLWQGGDSPGIAHVTVSTTSPTSSGGLDVPIVCPVPENVMATGVGSGKIAIYWDICPGATGYEVYRGTTAGGSKSLLSGMPQPSFDGSSKMVFIDQSSVLNDTTYFYAVRAVYSCGVSDESDEDIAVANGSAIPWDTRNPSAIVPAASLRTDGIADVFIAIGPDGTSYTSGAPPLLPWPFDLGPVPGDRLAAAGTSSQPREQVAAAEVDPCPDANKKNANSGPYIKVQSRVGRSYRKISAIAALPTDPNTKVKPHLFPDGWRLRKKVRTECPDSGDCPFTYLGGTGWVFPDGKPVGKYPVDGGLRYEATDKSWNLFFLLSSGTFWVFDRGENPLYAKFKDTIPDLPPPPRRDEWADYSQGQQVLMQFECTRQQVSGKSVKSGVALKVSGVDRKTNATNTMQVFAEQPGFPQTGENVTLKWVTSIGQYFPELDAYADKKDWKRGYVNSESFIKHAGWDSVQVWDTPTHWEYFSYSNLVTCYEKIFPEAPAMITTTGQRAPYYTEPWIDIDLAVTQ